MAHECTKEDFLGRVAEFMENMKGFKATLFIAVLTILASVGSAIWWGSHLTTVVDQNTNQVWCKLTPTAEANAKNIAILLEKFKNIKIIGYAEKDANAEPTGKGSDFK